VPAVPSPDVYTVLAQNPGLAASLPIYSQPQVTGRWSSLTVIGDSYADWGNALQFNPVSTQVGANGRYGNALNIIDALQYHYALPTSSVANYAFGGATTGSVNNNPPALQLPGFAQQVQALVDSGRRFGPSDLITFTTAGVGGGNDTPLGISIAQGTANIVGYMNALVGLGGRNFLINGQATAGNPALDNAVKAALLPALAPFASEGAHIYFFDEAALADSILANPTAYGFAPDATSVDYCTRFGGTHVCNEGGINKVRTQTTAEILAEDQYLYFYAHPTTSLAAWIAQGDASLLDASAQAVPEPGSLGILGFGLLAIVVSTVRRRC
jgi:phospholipase/lecithinase/hemolysin